MPVMQRVESSSLAAVGYDRECARLYARFVESPQVYVYHDVPEWVYLELMQASSMGVYMNTRIKPHYEYSLLKRRA